MIMSFAHKTLAAGRWLTFSPFEQLGHVGSEIDRAVYWSRAGKSDHTFAAVDRALELLDLTIADPRWRRRLKELLRARDVVADRFYGTNEYHTNDASLQRYFFQFALAARKDH